MAISNITSNDTINGFDVLLGHDVNIAVVNNTTPIVIDKNSGQVTVTAGTSGGVYTADYTLCEIFDPSNCSDANVTVHVKNHAPVAEDDLIQIIEDARVDIEVLNNDTDFDGDTIKILSVIQPEHGIVAINTDNTHIQYRPDISFNGSDSFTYTITDGNGGTDDANVTIEINGTNVAPNATNDTNSTNEDTAITIIVLANDIDTDGDTINIVSLTTPAHGIVTQNEDQSLVYTPNENYHGVDIFTYTISDGKGHTDSGVVTVNILSVNDLPRAVDDFRTTIENNSVTVNILENDTDIESSHFTTLSTTEPENGSVVVNTDGSITYTPDEDFNGSDSFDYTMQDEDNATDVATVVIVVVDNQAPLTRDDNLTAAVGDTVTINVLQNDSDEDNATDITSVKIIGADNNGTLLVKDEGVWHVNVEGQITFTPNIDFIGDPQPIHYTVADDLGNISKSAVVKINYIQKNPQTVDDLVKARVGELVIVKVLDNDTDDQDDIDASRLRIVDRKSAATVTKLYVYNEGTWNVDKYGTITFEPEYDLMHSPTAIHYRVSDRAGHISGQAKVSIVYSVIKPTITPTPTPMSTPTPTPMSTLTPRPLPIATPIVIPKPVVIITPVPTPTVRPSPTPRPIITPHVTPQATPIPVAEVCMIKANNDLDVKVSSLKGTVIGVLVNDACLKSCGSMTYTQGAYGTINVDDAGTNNNLKDDVLIYVPESNMCNVNDSFEYTITDCQGNSTTATVALDICTRNKSSNGTTYNMLTIILMILLTGFIGLTSFRREEV
jgi:CshA-type fibril repeat protein